MVIENHTTTEHAMSNATRERIREILIRFARAAAVHGTIDPRTGLCGDFDAPEDAFWAFLSEAENLLRGEGLISGSCSDAMKRTFSDAWATA